MMSRLNIYIILGEKENLNELALKYFILSLDTLQKSYEFKFIKLDKPIDLAILKKYEHQGIKPEIAEAKLLSEIEKKLKIKKNSYYIIICESPLPRNYFWHAKDYYGILTTHVWEKHYSPPSVFEFIVHSIIGILLYLDPDLKIMGHGAEIGCIRDFNRKKESKRNSILVGYISEKVESIILEKKSQEFLQDIKTIIDRKWIGKKDDFMSVAYELKNSFKIDIDKDSGFKKTIMEKITESFVDIPQKLIILFFGSLLGLLSKIIYDMVK